MVVPEDRHLCLMVLKAVRLVCSTGEESPDSPLISNITVSLIWVKNEPNAGWNPESDPIIQGRETCTHLFILKGVCVAAEAAGK